MTMRLGEGQFQVVGGYARVGADRMVRTVWNSTLRNRDR
jgi:hypothetical protein